VLLHVLLVVLLVLVVLLRVAQRFNPGLDLLLALGPQPIGPPRVLPVVLTVKIRSVRVPSKHHEQVQSCEFTWTEAAR
jgi:hypothetical protein